jgi:predicted RNase H-like HicB family nuclease
MVRYRLVLTPIQEGTFIAMVPDMPRLCATGRTQAEAASQAGAALRERVKAAMRQNQILKPPPEPALDEPYLEVSYGDLAIAASRSAALR